MGYLNPLIGVTVELGLPHILEYKTLVDTSCLCCVSVPVVAPSNVIASNPGTTRIRLSWYFENNVRDVLGILTGFWIFYQLANSSSAPEQRLEVRARKRRTHVNGLQIYRFYRFSIAGKTRIGHGVISADVYMRTLGTGLSYIGMSDLKCTQPDSVCLLVYPSVYACLDTSV